ncbi:MAG: phosphoglucomutase, alpha-D-glucose phosphate-specific [Alphaproteobacteria bacterium]|nr:phosphoglucomutase, alpha-D-glucose phosphate-specific [Alphaproteobacteria bacterium]
MTIDPGAGTVVPPDAVLDVAKLIQAFFDRKPDVSVPGQRVAFGTSGHRGSSFDTTFNENHIVAITQAICRYRESQGIDGPLYMGRDTHALSEPAFHVALEVLAANGVHVLVDSENGFTPTPVVSHAILQYNKGRTGGLADGIVITPSHNPPQDGGFKYNPPDGGPAASAVTSWIETFANTLLKDGLRDVRRTGKADSANGLPFDFRKSYVDDLDSIIDMQAIRAAGVRIGVDPLGGAATRYWPAIAERFGIDLTVTDPTIDPTFKTVPRDWDGKIRMDCSSRYPMARLIARSGDFDIAFANDTDADRHGIVTRAGLMPPNDYLATCAHYLGQDRAAFQGRAVGKTVVSSAMIDRVAAAIGRKLFEVPVGFKWFVDGLVGGTLYFCGEESAGASFLRRDGQVWTTDKDGLIAGLLAAEITARTGGTPDILFGKLRQELGETFYARVDQPADAAFRARLGKITPESMTAATLAGDAIVSKLVAAPGNGAAIGGIKISTKNGWAAARPSGTEDIYKIYAESFVSAQHLAEIQKGMQDILVLLRE